MGSPRRGAVARDAVLRAAVRESNKRGADERRRGKGMSQAAMLLACMFGSATGAVVGPMIVREVQFRWARWRIRRMGGNMVRGC